MLSAVLGGYGPWAQPAKGAGLCRGQGLGAQRLWVAASSHFLILQGVGGKDTKISPSNRRPRASHSPAFIWARQLQPLVSHCHSHCVLFPPIRTTRSLKWPKQEGKGGMGLLFHPGATLWNLILQLHTSAAERICWNSFLFP